MDKKKLLVIFLLALSAMIVAGFYLYNSQNVSVQEQSQREAVASIEKTEFAGTQFPPSIPSDLPVEAGSKVLESSESKTSDGRIQSTVSLTTSNTLSNSFNSYVEFFETKNWLEIESLRETTTERITTVMQYQSNRLMIEVFNDDFTGEQIIKLVLLESSKE
ncbi:MAG TPA: hypothetical protein PKD34_02435 [Candidatus Doudnabacteria bacterium]|nr:hypothetical protein [Candidatus Doudnabacteria bacterium]